MTKQSIQNNLKEVDKRSGSQRETILDLLRKAGRFGVTNHELVKVCIGYRSRIAEMYQMGYKIKTVQTATSEFLYVLVSEPDTPVDYKAIPKAKGILAQEVESRGVVDAITLMEIIDELGFNIVRKQGYHKEAVAL